MKIKTAIIRNTDERTMQLHAYDVRFYVYEDGKEIGHAGLTQSEDRFWISDVAIDDQYQHRGYGTKLIKHIIEFLKPIHRGNLWVSCFDNRKTFYEELGFKIHDVLTGENGRTMYTLRYEGT